MVTARATVSGALAAGAILITGWAVGTANGAAPAAVLSTASGSGGSSTSASSGAGSTGTSSGSSGTEVVDGIYTGTASSTRFGDVQVSVTITGGQITDVTALRLTDTDGRSISISNRAAPILREEVISAQSSAVSMVSGATYTSRAYLASVQSALDQAGL